MTLYNFCRWFALKMGQSFLFSSKDGVSSTPFRRKKETQVLFLSESIRQKFDKVMLKRLVGLFCLFFTGCSSGGPLMSVSAFYDVPIGASYEELKASAGDPISIRRFPDGSIEYEYIERFKVGARILNERHYYVLVMDGQVVSKRVKQTSPLPYRYDSYEMQTTQKEGSQQMTPSDF